MHGWLFVFYYWSSIYLWEIWQMDHSIFDSINNWSISGSIFYLQQQQQQNNNIRLIPFSIDYSLFLPSKYFVNVRLTLAQSITWSSRFPINYLRVSVVTRWFFYGECFRIGCFFDPSAFADTSVVSLLVFLLSLSASMRNVLEIRTILTFYSGRRFIFRHSLTEWMVYIWKWDRNRSFRYEKYCFYTL